jgi:hypothetical protein
MSSFEILGLCFEELRKGVSICLPKDAARSRNGCFFSSLAEFDSSATLRCFSSSCANFPKARTLCAVPIADGNIAATRTRRLRCFG